MKSASLQYANALADVARGEGATTKATPGSRFKDASAADGATIVVDTGVANQAARELADFGAAYAESAELRTFLASPAVALEAKHAVIEKIVARLGASRIIRNFLFIIADHHRTQLLPEIIASFQEVLRQRKNIAVAEISSAVELSVAQKKELLQTLEKLSKKTIEATYSLEPALLGGVVVRIGDTIYDGSLRNRLNEMRARLAAE